MSRIIFPGQSCFPLSPCKASARNGNSKTVSQNDQSFFIL